jgi:hypothetical protein
VVGGDGLQEQVREAARLGQGEERGWLNGPWVGRFGQGRLGLVFFSSFFLILF